MCRILLQIQGAKRDAYCQYVTLFAGEKLAQKTSRIGYFFSGAPYYGGWR
jgi:hypothetical protein